VPLRSSTPASTVPPRTPAGAAARRDVPPPDEPGTNRTTIAVAGGVLAVILLAVLLITGVFSGSGPAKPKNRIAATPSATPTTPASPSTPALNRSATTVVVLNGTTTVNLAGNAANKLETKGYKRGPTGDTVDKPRAQSAVSYAPGARRAAADVAGLLGIASSQIVPLDAGTKVTAESATGGPTPDVVVTLGQDKAQ
jgi:hypothetical protein